MRGEGGYGKRKRFSRAKERGVCVFVYLGLRLESHT